MKSVYDFCTMQTCKMRLNVQGESDDFASVTDQQSVAFFLCVFQ